jgi:phosphatidylserine decarboxylase
MFDRLFVLVQYVLPRYWLTALVHRCTRIRSRAVKNFLIRRFVRLYDVDVEDVRLAVPDDFATFNEFFVRELADGARPIAPEPDALVSPVDGTVSSAGRLRGRAILQAKGIDYTLEELLAADIDDARLFVDGSFATLYLAPHDYHRVHAPCDGELLKAHYVPGDLFSVNGPTVAHLPGVFCRNERLLLHFSTAVGRAVVVFVGAMNVGSISTPWTGEIRPQKRGTVEAIDLDAAPKAVHKGDLLGWFNMGSTVIALLPAGACDWVDGFGDGASVRMGERIGRLSDGRS